MRTRIDTESTQSHCIGVPCVLTGVSLPPSKGMTLSRRSDAPVLDGMSRATSIRVPFGEISGRIVFDDFAKRFVSASRPLSKSATSSAQAELSVVPSSITIEPPSAVTVKLLNRPAYSVSWRVASLPLDGSSPTRTIDSKPCPKRVSQSAPLLSTPGHVHELSTLSATVPFRSITCQSPWPRWMMSATIQLPSGDTLSPEIPVPSPATWMLSCTMPLSECDANEVDRVDARGRRRDQQ